MSDFAVILSRFTQAKSKKCLFKWEDVRKYPIMSELKIRNEIIKGEFAGNLNLSR